MEERLKEFKSKLADLMEEYEVEISASDEWTGYAECGEDIQITFFIEGKVIDNTYLPYSSENFGECISIEQLRNQD
ncbi:hypothetical protein JGH11_17030 [Dysgonomonas sp. Marseille-P4677]|uniref:hypothetical protein n=1 Tax=Dysgonomonas sp. Marseille-P4677 TaxID=2364790 RepID=UPI001914C2AA|nr:hypothetical protein [Dysgonomonas sp. Marseille-P4677]MBK5722580.1 hypothetical protein [Dysgonomonas sp. Marseille-P4677]